MKILLVHQNFPGQYLHLAAQPGNEVVFFTQRQGASLPGFKNVAYQPHRKISKNQHHYLTDAESAVLNAQAVARTALDLKQQGFVPDVMQGHNGWGEIWFLKDVFPHVPLILNPAIKKIYRQLQSRFGWRKPVETGNKFGDMLAHQKPDRFQG